MVLPADNAEQGHDAVPLPSAGSVDYAMLAVAPPGTPISARWERMLRDTLTSSINIAHPFVLSRLHMCNTDTLPQRTIWALSVFAAAALQSLCLMRYHRSTEKKQSPSAYRASGQSGRGAQNLHSYNGVERLASDLWWPWLFDLGLLLNTGPSQSIS